MQIQMQLEKCQAGTRSRSGLGELHTSHTSGRQLMIGELPLPQLQLTAIQTSTILLGKPLEFFTSARILKTFLLITLPLSIAFYLFLDVHNECLEI